MIRYIEYGEYTVGYEIEGDVDGIHAQIESIELNGEPVCETVFDKEDIADMKFHCECEFSDLQFKHYLKTGEDLA